MSSTQTQTILSPQRTPRRRMRRPRKLKQRATAGSSQTQTPSSSTQAADLVLSPVRTPIRSMLERTQSSQTTEKLTDSLSNATFEKENFEVNTPEKAMLKEALFDMAELKTHSPLSPIRKESALNKQLILSPSSPIRRAHRLSSPLHSPLRRVSGAQPTLADTTSRKSSGNTPHVHLSPEKNSNNSGKRDQRQREELSKSLRRSLCHEISASSVKKEATDLRRQLDEMRALMAEKETQFAAQLAEQQKASALLLQEKACMLEVMENTLNEMRQEKKTKDAEYELLVSSLYGQKEEVSKRLQQTIEQSEATEKKLRSIIQLHESDKVDSAEREEVLLQRIQNIEEELTGKLAEEKRLHKAKEQLWADLQQSRHSETTFRKQLELLTQLKEETESKATTEKSSMSKKISKMNSHIERLHRDYFFATALAIKMDHSMYGKKPCNTSVASLYQLAREERVPTSSWPRWINRRILLLQ